MSSWAIVALVAILLWGVVQTARARAGFATDAHTGDARGAARIAAEIEPLRDLPAARTEGTDQ